MPANTVEAVLRSKYEDGINDSVENTRALFEKSMSAMKDASGALASGVQSAFDSAVGSLEGWRTSLSKAADESDSSFKKMGLGAAAVGIAFAEVFLRGIKAAADFVVEITKEASEVAAARFSFEALTAAQGINADQMLGKLKQATEGQIGQLTLLRNANKVLGADLPLTGEQYLKLTENVARLAKSTGTDAVAAQDALTTALLRGVSRGLGPAIGIHLAVKDAVTEMADAMNTSAAALPDHAKLQGFYNDLLQKTDAAVSQLPPRFITLEEAITEAKNTWKDWLDDLGTAVTRSGVFQQLLVDVTTGMDGYSSSMDEQKRMALGVNDALIKSLQIIAALAEGIGPLITICEAAWAGVEGLVFSVSQLFIVITDLFAGIVDYTLRATNIIAKAFGLSIQSTVDSVKEFRSTLQTLGDAAHDGFEHSFDGVGDGAQKLSGLSAKATALATDMEKLRGTVLDGSNGVKTHAQILAEAAQAQKDLADQTDKYREKLFSLQESVASPAQKAIDEVTHEIAEINKQFTLLKPPQLAELYDAVWEKYHAEEAKRLDEENAKQKAAADKLWQEKQQANQKLMDLETRFYLETATEEQKAWVKREQDFRQITAATVAGSEERARLQVLVEKAYDAEMEKIQTARLLKQQQADKKAADEATRAATEQLRKQQEAEKKSLEDALAAASSIEHAVAAAAKGTISQNAALTAMGNLPQVLDTLKKKLAELNAQPVVTDAQITQIEKLKTAIDQLNKINFHPFQSTLTQMKNNMQQFATQSLQSFSQYLGGLLSGQSQTNKSLLQMAGQMVGGLFSMAGTLLLQTGVAECAAALTMVGRAMGASFAGGAEAIAAGIALTALGSALGGSGNSSGGSASASSPASSSSSTNPNPQIISVGTPNSGNQQASQNQQTQHLVTLNVQSNDSHIVKVVQSNLNQNGVLRVAVKQNG